MIIQVFGLFFQSPDLLSPLLQLRRKSCTMRFKIKRGLALEPERAFFMLNFFLVLGLIPGTNIQLTFNEIVFIFALLVGGLWLHMKRRPLIIIKQEVIQLSRLHSFSFPITNQQAESTGHKAGVLPVSISSLRSSSVARLIRRVA